MALVNIRERFLPHLGVITRGRAASLAAAGASWTVGQSAVRMLHNWLVRTAHISWHEATRALNNWIRGGDLGLGASLEMRMTRTAQRIWADAQQAHNVGRSAARARRGRQGDEMHGEDGWEAVEEEMPEAEAIQHAASDLPMSDQRGTTGGGFTSAKGGPDEDAVYDYPATRHTQPGVSDLDPKSRLIISKETPLYYQYGNLSTGSSFNLLPGTAAPAVGTSITLNWKTNPIIGAAKTLGNDPVIYSVKNNGTIVTHRQVMNNFPRVYNPPVTAEVPTPVRTCRAIDHCTLRGMGCWGSIQPWLACHGHNNMDLFMAQSKYERYRMRVKMVFQDSFNWHQSASGQNFVQSNNRPDVCLVEVPVEIIRSETRHCQIKCLTSGGTAPASLLTGTSHFYTNYDADLINYWCANSNYLSKYDLNQWIVHTWDGTDYTKDFGWSEWFACNGDQLDSQCLKWMQGSSATAIKASAVATGEDSLHYYAFPLSTTTTNEIRSNDMPNSDVSLPPCPPYKNYDYDNTQYQIWKVFGNFSNADVRSIAPDLNAYYNPNRKTIAYTNTNSSNASGRFPSEALMQAAPMGRERHLFNNLEMLKVPMVYCRNIADTSSMQYLWKMCWKMCVEYEFAGIEVVSRDWDTPNAAFTLKELNGGVAWTNGIWSDVSTTVDENPPLSIEDINMLREHGAKVDRDSLRVAAEMVRIENSVADLVTGVDQL